MQVAKETPLPLAHHQAPWSAFELPAPTAEVLPGIAWGCASELFSPAFWKFQTKSARSDHRQGSFRLGNSLMEEVAVCLLGGHGQPAELCLAAFERVRDRGLLSANTAQWELEAALQEPLVFGSVTRRYRFPRQKAKFLWHAVQAISKVDCKTPGRQLRDQLTKIPGIGPKTASWVVRNHYGSNDVAILDVHILRAGAAMGLFSKDADPSREYDALEERFLVFCDAIEEPASLVDSLMWDVMRRVGPTSTIMKQRRQLELLLCQ